MHTRTVLIAAAIALVAGCAADTKATHQRLTMEETPIAVRRGIEKACPDAKVERIERETYTQTKVVHYQVKAVTATGRKVELELAEDGSVLQDD